MTSVTLIDSSEYLRKGYSTYQECYLPVEVGASHCPMANTPETRLTTLVLRLYFLGWFDRALIF